MKQLILLFADVDTLDQVFIDSVGIDSNESGSLKQNCCNLIA